jgi:hypothetical protein
MAEEEREPGPRDWEPTDPDSRWWNPKPGDPYGPSDQEYRQPWERPRPVHRFPGGAVPPPPTGTPPPAPFPPSSPRKRPPENHPKTEGLLGVAVLALLAILISCGLGVFVEDWRRGVSYPMIGAATLLGAVLVLAAAGSLRRALALRTRSRMARVGYDVVAVVVVFLIPASVGAFFMSGQWLPAGYLVLLALVIALVGAIVASMVRDRVEKREQGAPTPRLVAQVVHGSVLFGLVVVCVGGVATGAVWGFNRIVHDDLADRGAHVPAVAMPEPSPTWLPTDPTATDPVPQVRHDLEQRVLLIARVVHPVTSRCVRVDSGPDDSEIQYACTVTYAGHDMVFTVIGSGQGDTGELDRYEANADRVVVTRKGLQSQFREAYPQAEELRCDEFPEFALVSTAEPLPQHCYVKVGWSGRFMELTINPRDDGPPTYRDVDA